jgi:hypothetical protein
LKRNSEKEDKMFGFGFDNKENIYWTRGSQVSKPIKEHLLENRIEMINEMLE